MSESHSIPELRPISHFPGYHVSADGRLWTTKKLVYGGQAGCQCRYDGPPKELKLKELPKSPHYKYATLVGSDKRQHSVLVSRAVLEAFVGPCPEGMECRHLDGNAHNNRLDNLKWGTPLENAADKSRHGRQCHMKGETNGFHKLDEEEILAIRERYAKGGVTYRDLAEEYNIAPSNVRFIVKRLTWKHL